MALPQGRRGIATLPKTWGLDHCANLTNPDTVTLNAAKALSHNRETMATGREVADVEAVAVGILPMEESRKMMGTTTVRAMLLTTRGIQGTDPNQFHTLSIMIPMIW